VSVLATLAAIAVSLAGFAHLAATDPKRRRAFRLPDPAPRRPGLGWAAVLLPGLLVPIWAGAAGFFVWLGAASVLGWTLAAASPQRTAALRRAADDRLLGLRRRAEALLNAGRTRWAALQRPRQPTLAERVRELEREVAALKARLAIPAGPPDVVVELPRPRSRQG
jgi:hypothetical protein